GRLKTAALTPPAEPDDRVLSDVAMLREVRQRLYELNFDPGPFDGPFGEPARNAVREFEEQNHLAMTGVPSFGLLRRLRAIDGVRPWGAIVYAKGQEKWGMSWGEATRQAAVARARANCGDPKTC